MSGGGGGIFVLFIAIAIGIMIFKISMARGMAEKSGMDPDDATLMTLLDDNGLSATCLASNLRPETTDSPPPKARTAHADAATRLEELKGLLADGLITQAEYDERRKAIIAAI